MEGITNIKLPNLEVTSIVLPLLLTKESINGVNYVVKNIKISISFARNKKIC